ncbi:amino acid synthesis family protein [Brucella pituitosa]|uniref:Amino acid synthesis family protein n=1 Tax=Brucella pituitosa TaxID=571256 RepID=A0ABS3K5T1_9HYPH|nr:amino acid synthesis family protein [Brucella pituitosa]MBO1041166.1 amino acid synthesis family protein [Brucella pituitosa]
MDFGIRKIFFQQERVFSDTFLPAARPIRRVAGVAVITNPFAGQGAQSLDPLFEIGENIGEMLASEMQAMFSSAVTSYGKAALVGMDGELEHGHALIHPRLGRAMRKEIGGGEALIPSVAKVCSSGSTIDVPLGNKDDAWSFDHFDTITVSCADAPRAGELALVVAFADGGRPVARIGTGRAR